MEIGRFRGGDGVGLGSGVEIGRFRGGDGVGLGIRGWRLVVFRGGDGVGFRDQGWRLLGVGVEMGWVYGSGGGDW